MNEENTFGEFKQWGINRFAYVNRFKQIPNSNPPAYVVSLCEPHGRKNNFRYVYYDLTVRELTPFSLLNEHQQSINDRDIKVSIQFNCYNTYPQPFIYKDNKGEIVYENGEPKMGASMRGFLSSISRMKIDDKVVYQYQGRKDQQGHESNERPASQPKATSTMPTLLRKKLANKA